ANSHLCQLGTERRYPRFRLPGWRRKHPGALRQTAEISSAFPVLTPGTSLALTRPGPLAIDALLKRYFLGVVLALVAVAAYFQAAGATQLVGSAIGAAAASGAPPVVVPPYKLAVPTREPKSGQPIIERNPFDSVTGPLNPVEVTAPSSAPAGPDLSDPLASPACDGIQVLIVT